MDTPNPLAHRAAPVAEDLGPDLKPTGKSRGVWDGEEWTAERRGFDHYLAARGMGGMADTASSRMQAKQVREMEKALDAGQAGVNPNFKLTDALNGTPNMLFFFLIPLTMRGRAPRWFVEANLPDPKSDWAFARGAFSLGDGPSMRRAADGSSFQPCEPRGPHLATQPPMRNKPVEKIQLILIWILLGR